MTAVPFLFLAVYRSVARLALIGSLTQSRVPGKEETSIEEGPVETVLIANRCRRTQPTVARAIP